MSSIGQAANQYYDTKRNTATWLGLADISFSAFPTMTLSPPTRVTVELAGGSGPDLNTVPGASFAYFILRSIQLQVLDKKWSEDRNHEPVGNSQIVTIPNGGGSQIFQLPGSDYLTSIGFIAWDASLATVGVSFINVDRNDGSFLPVTPSPSIDSTKGSQLQSLVLQYGPYGFEGLSARKSGGGNRVQVGFFNSSGASHAFTLVMTGSRNASNDISVDIGYASDTGIQLPLTHFTRLFEGDGYIPFNLQTPVPLSDPGKNTYGSIFIDPFVQDNFYNTSLELGLVVQGSVLYALPAPV